MARLITILFSFFLGISAQAAAASKNWCEVQLKTKSADGTVVLTPFDTADSWGRQLVDLRLDALADFYHRTSKLPDSEKLQIAFDEDVRKFFFQIESLFRVYQEQDKKFFKPLRKEFKDVEDKLGFTDLQRTLKKKAAEIGLTDLAEYFSQRQTESLKELTDILAVWNDAKLNEVREHIKKYPKWLAGKEDKKFLIEQLSNELLELHKDSKKAVFDEPDIEEGLHELRRRVRWIVIQVLSLNHMVRYQKEDTLSPAVQKWFNEFLAQNPEVTTNKYMKIDEVAIGKPVVIPLQMEAIVTSIVAQVGTLKDNSELQIELEKGMRAIGYSEEKIKTSMQALNANLGVQAINHQQLSRELEDRLVDSQLLIEYANQLKKLN